MASAFAGWDAIQASGARERWVSASLQPSLRSWEGAIAHEGVADLRAKRGRPAKAAGDRKEQIALRVDEDVLEWYRAQGPGWQTRMNAVLRAYRGATC